MSTMSEAMRKTIAVLVALAVLIGTFAVVTGDVSAATKPKKIYIKADAYKMSGYPVVDVKGKIKMSVYKTSPKNASKSVTWKTSSKSIATVSSNGTVTGKKAGIATITATSKSNKKAKKSLKIKVYDLKTQKIDISKSAVTLKRGASDATTTLSAKAYTKIGSTYTTKGWYNPGVSWKVGAQNPWSEGTTVATVNTSGKVYGKARGDAIVYAQAKDNSSKKSKDCTVNIYQKVTEVLFDDSSINISIGDTYANHVTVVPEDANNQSVAYRTADGHIANINSNAVIEGIGVGDTTVTATATADNVEGKCAVKVGQWRGVMPIFNQDIEGKSFVKYESSVPVVDPRVKFRVESARGMFDDITNGDISLAFGNDAIDMFDLDSVEHKFQSLELYYNFGNYVLVKEGNEIYIRYKTNSGEIVSKYLYYVQSGEYASLKPTANQGYELILYADENPTATTEKKTVTLNGLTDIITFSAENKNFDIHRAVLSNEYKISVRVDGELMARLNRDNYANRYTLWLDQTKVMDEGVFLYEYR